MGSVFRLLGAFLLSALIAGAAAVQIAILTSAREEFIAVLFALTLFLSLAIAVFAAGAFLSGQRSTLNILALGMAGLIVTAIASALTLTRSNTTHADVIVLATFGASALLGLVVQWWFARRVFA